MIEIENLTKTFGAFKAVDGLSLKVPPGEIYGFLGPNGAGKTTTVKILSGIMRPAGGRVLVDGIDMSVDPLSAKRRLAYIPDEPFVYPKLTGRELLRFIGDLYSVPVDEQEREIPKLLEMFDLSEAGGELLESYSHGMKQKLLIASVLLRKPKVVLFDEPTVGLDPRSIRRFRELLLDIARSGACVFMCTHILEMAEKLCGRVGIIYKGRLIAEGTVSELRRMSGSSADRTLEDIFLSLTEG
ncbi:MAG: ABC-2 type transport system ATP-binding protein [Elusimicrobia bacterium]|nr:MAG: ABC-2 type transport system ATP-binding protein [Elusimicrobiota bacterium]KAF0154319.1 MAG: ABC-2 type transport system ATP-binding protein [Elusimicrobiota bacterium]